MTSEPPRASAPDEPSDAGETPPHTAGDADLDASAVPFLHRRGAPHWRIESLLVRLIATSGIIGISVALAAPLSTQSARTWIIGLTASAVSVVLVAMV